MKIFWGEAVTFFFSNKKRSCVHVNAGTQKQNLRLPMDSRVLMGYVPSSITQLYFDGETK